MHLCVTQRNLFPLHRPDAGAAVAAEPERAGSAGDPPLGDTGYRQSFTMRSRQFTMSDYHSFNQNLIEEFRANNGQVTGPFAGAPLMLLTTTGAKSGKQRTTPLVHTRAGDNLVVIASKGGAPTNPDWYYNLVANPIATVELPNETFTVRAREATGDERDRLYAAQAEVMPNFAEYQKNTSRTIPLFVLERAS